MLYITLELLIRAGRLTELLPFGNARKQELFEMTDPLHRLAGIAEQLDEMSE